jgi:hypothetical protein
MRRRSSLLGILFVVVVMSACDQNTADSEMRDLQPNAIGAQTSEGRPTPAAQDGSTTRVAGAPADDTADSPRIADIEIRRSNATDRDAYYDAIRRAKAR